MYLSIFSKAGTKCVVLEKLPLKNNGEIEKLARKTTVKLKKVAGKTTEKYCKADEKDKPHIRACFNAAPKQLAKENKKYQYSKVESGG